MDDQHLAVPSNAFECITFSEIGLCQYKLSLCTRFDNVRLHTLVHICIAMSHSTLSHYNENMFLGELLII